MLPFFVDVVTAHYSDIKEFFVRDLTNFFSNLITNEDFTDELKKATLTYFLGFYKEILPKCAAVFAPHLNTVVSGVIPHIKSDPNSKLASIAMNLLNFLIVQQKAHLKESIALLDNFPAQPVFENLRKVHLNAKYGGRTFTLSEEIEYFLKVEKRKIEGLVALKEHVSAAH